MNLPMKKTIMAAGALFAALSATAAATASAGFDAGNRLSIRSGSSVLLTGDGVTLQDAQWKTIAAPMSAAPAVSESDGATVSAWKSENARVIRTVRPLPDGAVSVIWEAEFAPGIPGGKYIELALVAPKNSWTGFPPAPQRTIAESRSWIEVKPDAGTFYFDFTGSTGAWKFEEMRNVAWMGHLRLLFFSGYDPVKGAKFTAKLTVSPVKPATPPEKRPELRGNGDEYARVVLPAEEKNAAPLLAATFRVETKQPLRRSSARLFGYNNDWHGYEALGMIDPAKVKPDATENPVNPKLTAALEGVPVPFNRTAGTDSQLFRWRESVGANRDRRPFPLWFGRKEGHVPLYGLVEHFNWYRSLDPDAEFVYVVNLYNTTPEESRELAEFLTGGAETPLGKLRIACGLEKPVNPAVWELGNEMDLGGPKHMDVGPYVEACRAHIAAIRKACPDAVFAAHAASSPWDPERGRYWRNWNRTVLNELGPELTYLAFHPYYRGLTPDRMLGYLDELAEDIAASPNPAVKIFNSEHAKWPPGYGDGEQAWKRNWYQTHALVGVLDTAEWMLLMLNRPDVGAQTYHAFSAGPWALVRRDANGGYYTTGIAELFRFFGRDGYDGEVVRSHLEGAGTDPRSLPFHFTGAAELSPDGKALFLTLNNRLPGSERDLTLEFDDPAWKPVKMTILTAPALESVNSAADRPIAISGRAIESAGKTVRIPAKSLVRIRCER